MEGFILFCGLCLAMLLGCYFAGCVPLWMNFSESRLKLVTVLGAGLLVGTALAVIIPEGVQAIYQQKGGSNLHEHDDAAITIKASLPTGDGSSNKAQAVIPPLRPVPGESGKVDHIEIVEGPAAPGEPKDDHNHEAKHQEIGAAVPMRKDTKQDKFRRKREETIEEKGHLHWKRKLFEEHSHHADHDHEETNEKKHAAMISIEPHAVIGLTLVLGFVFMLCVDQFSQKCRPSVELGVVQKRYNVTATVGLVVHAAADGIALGAASSTSHTDIQFIVFVAIMLHKAPAAFGLVTFLMHEGLEHYRIRRHLLAFSLSAPLAALVTYLGIAQAGGDSLSLNTTGVLMLFSAGTFLYVATVHVLPEITSGSHGHSHGFSAVPSGTSGDSNRGFTSPQLFALIFGSLLPTVLTLGHSHSH